MKNLFKEGSLPHKAIDILTKPWQPTSFQFETSHPLVPKLILTGEISPVSLNKSEITATVITATTLGFALYLAGESTTFYPLVIATLLTHNNNVRQISRRNREEKKAKLEWQIKTVIHMLPEVLSSAITQFHLYPPTPPLSRN